MRANNFILKAGQGKNTRLDKAYQKLIIDIKGNLDEEKEERWETYNLIIEDLINTGKIEVFQEIKYRLTDNEDPNKVMLNIIDRYEDSERDNLYHILRGRIEEYIEEDFLKRFHD